MKSILISGSFTIADAQDLISRMYKAKTDFHVSKINTTNMSEEDIKHSEKKIIYLESELKKIQSAIKSTDSKYVTIKANLTLEL